MNLFLTKMFLLLSIVFSLSAFSQEPLDIQTTINSKYLQGTKNISIRLPQDYYEKQTSHVKYPVLYFLDAGRTDQHIHAEISTLSSSGIIPDFIIVGIKRDGRNRFRDFTPIKDNDNKGGGADNFLSFIEHELISYVEKNYRAADFKILQGHSLGGLFSLHAFQEKPELFQAHFAFSPSLDWADSTVTKAVKNYILSKSVKQSYLYANLGNEGLDIRTNESKTMREDFIELSHLLKNHHLDSFRSKVEFFDEDPHHLTQFTGMRRALRDLFNNWFYPHSASALGAKELKLHFDRLSKQLGYLALPQEGTIYWAGVANLRMYDNRKMALSFFKLYVDLYPQSISALENLADFYTEDNDLENAIQLMKKALSLVSNEDDRYSKLSKKLKEFELKLKE